ncbi:hypothetical protein KC365_g12 [Hortaea werneckii]|nr:hypothetical protein KC339_g11 [Hortaea werneckii]KAI7245913.1 hypothetical protein KC365_g12 [Hortaea werneckii]
MGLNADVAAAVRHLSTHKANVVILALPVPLLLLFPPPGIADVLLFSAMARSHRSGVAICADAEFLDVTRKIASLVTRLALRLRMAETCPSDSVADAGTGAICRWEMRHVRLCSERVMPHSNHSEHQTVGDIPDQEADASTFVLAYETMPPRAENGLIAPPFSCSFVMACGLAFPSTHRVAVSLRRQAHSIACSAAVKRASDRFDKPGPSSSSPVRPKLSIYSEVIETSYEGSDSPSHQRRFLHRATVILNMLQMNPQICWAAGAAMHRKPGTDGLPTFICYVYQDKCERN